MTYICIFFNYIATLLSNWEELFIHTLWCWFTFLSTKVSIVLRHFSRKNCFSTPRVIKFGVKFRSEYVFWICLFFYGSLWWDALSLTLERGSSLIMIKKQMKTKTKFPSLSRQYVVLSVGSPKNMTHTSCHSKQLYKFYIVGPDNCCCFLQLVVLQHSCSYNNSCYVLNPS